MVSSLKRPAITYQTRISKRAKRLQIRVKTTGEVEVVVPLQVDPAIVPRFVEHNESWIRQTLQRVTCPTSTQESALPETIALRALKRQWQVHYIASKGVRLEQTDRPKPTLQLHGSSDQQHFKQLRDWLHQQAKASLSPWIRELSETLNLPFNKLTIRGQKTRWGSCSSHRNININRNLLFLDAELVRYLFIHELCHTIHLNHSQHYWALVAEVEPDYKKLDQRLRRAMAEIPAWARSGSSA